MSACAIELDVVEVSYPRSRAVGCAAAVVRQHASRHSRWRGRRLSPERQASTTFCPSRHGLLTGRAAFARPDRG